VSQRIQKTESARPTSAAPPNKGQDKVKLENGIKTDFVNGANIQFYDKNLERTFENSDGGEDRPSESNVICTYYVR